MTDAFWAAIDAQLVELRGALDAGDVVRILNSYGPPSSGDAFFAGSGGDEGIIDPLLGAGWTMAWYEAHYHFCLRAPDGSRIEYVEGDIYAKAAPPSCAQCGARIGELTESEHGPLCPQCAFRQAEHDERGN